MEYLRFGNRMTSRIALGCMRISQLSPVEVDHLVHTALDHGICFFDHADIYGGGQSEEKFGILLKEEPSLRENMFLQSKTSIREGMYDCSGEYIIASVEKSLERLHTDHLDCLLLHRPDVLMEPQEVKEAFDQLEQSGKVLQFGFSNMNRYQMELLAASVSQKPAVSQFQMSIVHCPGIESGINVNLMNDAALMREAGTMEYCRMNDMVMQAWSPLQKGFFQGVFLEDEEYPRLNEVLQDLADRYGTSKDTIAYAWVLRCPGKVQCIAGTTRPDRLIHAAEAVRIQLSRKEWYDLYLAAGRTLP